MSAVSDGYGLAMSPEEQISHLDRTVAAMYDTAEQLQVSAGTLHGSAQASPNETSTARLNALGDEVTAQADDIDRRADRLVDEAPRGERPQPGGRRIGRRAAVPQTTNGPSHERVGP
jgi:hypothetical protein